MKVKIGDNIIDTNEDPIMLIFEDRDEIIKIAHNLFDMEDGATKYCVFPNGMDPIDVKLFMKTK